MPKTRTFSLLTAAAVAAACLSSALSPAPAQAETLSPDTIKNLAIDEAKKQGEAQDYSLPLQKPTWKVLFLGFSDVTNADKVTRDVMTADDRIYAKTVMDNFEQTLESRGLVDIVPTLKIDDVPLQVGDHGVIHEADIQEPLKRAAQLAEFDSILVFSKGNHGGITGPNYYSDQWAQGSGYSYVSLGTSNSPKYPGPTEAHEYSADVALHEFGHQMASSRFGYSYPDLHAGGDVKYNCGDGRVWCYYLDFLSGKILVKGVPKGTYPKMWVTSQRFLHRPAMATVHYQDAAGNTLAPDANIYGPGGDTYAVSAPDKTGYGTPVLKTGSEPATGTFVTGTRANITYVYPRTAATVSFTDGSSSNLTETSNQRSGAVFGAIRDYKLRASEPITGYRYIETLTRSSNTKAADTFDGGAIAWSSSGTATVKKDGTTYILTKKPENRVEISATFGAPTTEFSLLPTGYVGTGSTATMTRTLELAGVTPESTGITERPTAPTVTTEVNWSDTIALTFVDKQSAQNDVRTLPAGEATNNRYAYEATLPVTGYTYLDRLDSADRAKRLDRFAGTAVTWGSSNTATITRDGNTYTLVKKSDTLVEITVALSAATRSLVVYGMDYVNTASAGRATRTLAFANVVDAGTGTKEDQQKAPTTRTTATWGAYTTPVSFSGGETTDIVHSTTVNPGDKAHWTYGYRAAAPVTGFTYTDRLDPNNGAKRVDQFGGNPVTWNASGTATVSALGNTYTLVKKSDTLVEITVTLGTASTEFFLLTMDNTNANPTARTIRTIQVTSVTPASTNTKETLTNTARGVLTITWGAYKTPVSFSGGETTDIVGSITANPGDKAQWNYGYRAAAPVTGFTYTDRLDPNNGAKRLDQFNGTPITWNASGTATASKWGNTYTLVKKSDTLVEITVTLGTASTEFYLPTMDNTNANPTARTTRIIQVTSVTPASTNTKETITNAARGVLTITWGAYKTPVSFSGGETTDIVHSTTVNPGDKAHWTYGYRAAAPVTGFTYTDRLDPNNGAKRVDQFGGNPVTWNASGTATVSALGNTYTLVKKSDTLVEITVTLGTASTEFFLLTMDNTNANPTARTIRTIQVTSVTPASTNTKETLTNTARGVLTITWGAYK